MRLHEQFARMCETPRIQDEELRETLRKLEHEQNPEARGILLRRAQRIGDELVRAVRDLQRASTVSG